MRVSVRMGIIWLKWQGLFSNEETTEELHGQSQGRKIFYFSLKWINYLTKLQKLYCTDQKERLFVRRCVTFQAAQSTQG